MLMHIIDVSLKKVVNKYNTIIKVNCAFIVKQLIAILLGLFLACEIQVFVFEFIIYHQH